MNPVALAPPTAATPLGLFEDARAAWCRAAAETGARDYDLRIGSGLVRLRFAGTELAPRYLPALEGRVVPASSERPLVEVLLWDVPSTGCPPPAPGWSSSDRVARGEIPRFTDERVLTAYNVESSTLSIGDLGARVAVHCVLRPDDLPQWELGAPLRDILGWFLVTGSAQLVHAGAVGREDGGLLLVGRGGSGKSSTATACLGSSLRFAADDYCAVEVGGGEPRAASVYSTLKLVDGDVARFPRLSGSASSFSSVHGKRLVWLGGLDPAALIGGFPIRAVVLPRVASGEVVTRARRVGAGEALRALAPSTLFQIPGIGARSLDLMARLVRAVPAWALDLGSDRSGVVRALEDLLERPA